MKLLIGCLLAVGVCNAEILEPKASVRVLPADVLRGNYKFVAEFERSELKTEKG